MSEYNWQNMQIFYFHACASIWKWFSTVLEWIRESPLMLVSCWTVPVVSAWLTRIFGQIRQIFFKIRRNFFFKAGWCLKRLELLEKIVQIYVITTISMSKSMMEVSITDAWMASSIWWPCTQPKWIKAPVITVMQLFSTWHRKTGQSWRAVRMFSDNWKFDRVRSNQILFSLGISLRWNSCDGWEQIWGIFCRCKTQLLR